MNYVLMIHASESMLGSSITPAQHEALMKDYGAFTKELFETGRAGDCAALESVQTATTVRVRDGKRIVKDGPFAETREQLGGYYTLSATSEEEALGWAAKIPGAKHGTIEVRPVVPTMAPGGEKNEKAPDTTGKKEYVFLIYDDESIFAKMSEAELKSVFGGYGDFSASVKAARQYVAGDQLDAAAKAKSLQIKSGERVVRDGPFAETREQLGGYYRLWARDLDEAIALAARLPSAATGTIEIRPVLDTSKYM